MKRKKEVKMVHTLDWEIPMEIPPTYQGYPFTDKEFWKLGFNCERCGLALSSLDDGPKCSCDDPNIRPWTDSQAECESYASERKGEREADAAIQGMIVPLPQAGVDRIRAEWEKLATGPR